MNPPDEGARTPLAAELSVLWMLAGTRVQGKSFDDNVDWAEASENYVNCADDSVISVVSRQLFSRNGSPLF